MREMDSSGNMCHRFAPVLRALTWAAGNLSKQLFRVAQPFTAAITGSFRPLAADAAVNCDANNMFRSDTAISSKSSAPLGPRLSAAIVLALFSFCAFADSGSDIYKAHCSACHATSGAGDTMLGKNLKLRPLSSPEVQQQSDEELFSITSKGKKRMPAATLRLSCLDLIGCDSDYWLCLSL